MYTEFKNYVSKDIVQIKLCIERLKSEKVTGISNLKNEMKQIKESFKSLEESFDLLSIKSTSKKVKSVKSDNSKPCNPVSQNQS